MSEAYRPVTTLSRTLVALLVACGALGALGGLLGLVQGIAFPELAGLDEPQTPAHTAMLFGVGCSAILYVAVYVATVVVFSMFTHRTCANAHALGARGMEFTPGWAVGWYFIPFMNLFKPYQAVKEMHQALDPEAGSDDWRLLGDIPTGVGWWWAAWIVSNFLGNISTRLTFSSDPSALAIAPWFDVVDGGMDVVLSILAVIVVRSLTARQERKARVASFA